MFFLVLCFLALAAIAPAMDAQTFNLVASVLIGAACSYILKWAPLSWKGKPMAAFAIVGAILVEAVELFVTGQLTHFTWTSAADILAAVAGVQGFFAFFKDSLHLKDPATPATPAAAVPPPKVV